MLRSVPEGGLVVFLVSGGGSAMFELPVDERITLNDLREANRQLVQCGATIAEINSVRRAFSAVKGGKLSDCASQADQITLIVSDTNPGDEAAVASGPTLRPAESAPKATDVVRRIGLDRSLPKSILNAIEAGMDAPQTEMDGLRMHQVLLDNRTAVEAAARQAEELGFVVEIANDINEQEIGMGCELLDSRAHALWEKSAKAKTVCLISGGEFSCPVRGEGVGGRNSETVLGCAIRLSEVTEDQQHPASRWIVLSAGTDGIDGNSPAAGAVADETTIARGLSAGLDASDFLARSDSFSYFQRLGDVLVTGPTGTNVRDIRIIIRMRDEG
jgi:hydroxypyruvate reductase